MVVPRLGRSWGYGRWDLGGLVCTIGVAFRARQTQGGRLVERGGTRLGATELLLRFVRRPLTEDLLCLLVLSLDFLLSVSPMMLLLLQWSVVICRVNLSAVPKTPAAVNPAFVARLCRHQAAALVRTHEGLHLAVHRLWRDVALRWDGGQRLGAAAPWRLRWAAAHRKPLEGGNHLLLFGRAGAGRLGREGREREVGGTRLLLG